MSNPLFKPVNVVDSRIDDIVSEIPYVVYSGGAYNTFQNFPSNSQNNTGSIIYNIQVPFTSTIIDRNMLQQATITLQISLSNIPKDAIAFNYGYTDSLQAFPLNSLILQQSANINNTAVTCNLKDILPQILRMYDNETLSRYNSLAPAMPDTLWKNYSDAVGTNSNPLAGLNNTSYNVNLQPRGSFPVTIGTVVHNIFGGGTDNSFTSTNIGDTWTFPLTFTTTEPILGMSPFLHTANNNSAGFLGINALSLQFNIDASCSRVFSSSTGYISNISVSSITNTAILMNFLTLQPEQYTKIAPRNVLPYIDLPRYTFQNTAVCPALPANAPISAGIAVPITFSNLQLNQVPDLLIIVARKPMGLQTYTDSSSFLTIKGVSVNFNANSGILSTASPQQLYNMSVKNGSSQSFYEFAGQALVNDNATGKGTFVPTLGSMLVLNPSLDFGLSNTYSAGSQGQFNLQFIVNVVNQTDVDITPEILLMVVNSGLFINEIGTSIVQTGILIDMMVLET